MAEHEDRIFDQVKALVDSAMHRHYLLTNYTMEDGKPNPEVDEIAFETTEKILYLF